MHRTIILIAIILTMSLAACGGGDGDNNFVGTDFDYIVDEQVGDDANPGTIEAPFKTISKALSVVTSSESIRVRPGTYDEGNGEIFPLIMPAGVTMIGEEETHGGADGGAVTEIMNAVVQNTLETGADTVIAGFQITNNASKTGVLITGAAVEIRNNSIEAAGAVGIGTVGDGHLITGNVVDKSTTGILIQGDGTLLEDNFLTDNTDTGVIVIGDGHLITGNVMDKNATGIFIQGDGARLEDNFFTDNSDTGVKVIVDDTSGMPDFGGGAADSTGGNTISCNTNADLLIDDSAATVTDEISAENNFWDHAPPSNNDISIVQPLYTVETLGAVETANPCP
jgi:hypothetical protein